MPTTRKRRERSATLSTGIIATLGVGTGINHMPITELQALWREHGRQVTDYWHRTYGDASEPFVAMLARVEGW